MRTIIIGVFLLCLPAGVAAANPPLVEMYIHSGDLARGEQALLLALERNPKG